MSCGPGSETLASFCATSKIGCLRASAASRALMDFWRPTKIGYTWCGKTISSRKGRRGTVSPCPLRPSFLSFLSLSLRKSIGCRSLGFSGGFGGFLVDQQRLFFLRNHLLGNQNLLDVGLRGDLVHQIHHDGFHYSTQAAGPRLALERLARDRAQSPLGEFEVDVLHVEQFLVLAYQRVLGFGQNPHQRVLVQLAERRDYRQAPDEFRNQSELEQVLGLHLVEQLGDRLGIAMGEVGPKAHRLARDAPADDVVEADERAAADEQDVGGVDLQELLLRMLASALGRYARHRALDDLEQRLLHTLAGDVAR